MTACVWMFLLSLQLALGNIKGNQDVSMSLLAPAIIGGDTAKPMAWPWHAAVYGYGAFQCSGSLINNRWVLTAAHCLINQLSRPILISDLSVRLGIHLLSTPEPEAKYLNVTRTIIHPAYSTKLENDIGLIEMAQSVMTSKSILPINLPYQMEYLPEGTQVFVTGWGYIHSDINPKITSQQIKNFGTIYIYSYIRVQPDELQQLQSEVMKASTCNTYTKNQINTICLVDTKGGRATCQGDSGGPLMVKNSRNNRWTLYGVQSSGDLQCGASKLAGIYTQVSAYVNWIRSIIA